MLLYVLYASKRKKYFNRYIAVCHPFRASALCTKYKARCSIIAILLFAGIFSIPQVLFAFGSYRNYGYIIRNYRLDYIYFIGMIPVFMYLIPLSILLFITVRLRMVLKLMLEQRMNIQKEPQGKDRERRITISLFVILTVFLVCQCTTCLVYLVDILQYWVIDTDHDFVYKIIFMSFVGRHVLIVFNSSVNVLIYVYFSKHYRRLVRKHVLRYTCMRSSRAWFPRGKKELLYLIQI